MTPYDVLTLTIYDNPTAVEPNVAALVSVPRKSIVSASYNVQHADCILTLTGLELTGESTHRWFQRGKPDKEGKVQAVPGQYDQLSVGEINGRPIALHIVDKEQVQQVWEFMHPDDELGECPIFKHHEAYKEKLAAVKEETNELQVVLKEEMNKPHIYDTAGNLLSSDNVSKIITMEQ